MKSIFFYKTSIGRIGIVENDGRISNLYFESDNVPIGVDETETPLIKEAALQIMMYLDGKLTCFSLPIEPEGTKFMKSVWHALCEVGYGATATYKDIARRVGNPNGARAVGNAIGRNPIPIIVPCHRIIGSNGSITGYRGGVKLKKVLLDIEMRNEHL